VRGAGSGRKVRGVGGCRPLTDPEIEAPSQCGGVMVSMCAAARVRRPGLGHGRGPGSVDHKSVSPIMR